MLRQDFPNFSTATMTEVAKNVFEIVPLIWKNDVKLHALAPQNSICLNTEVMLFWVGGGLAAAWRGEGLGNVVKGLLHWSFLYYLIFSNYTHISL